MPERFDPPIQLNRDVLPEFPVAIATRREAAILECCRPAGCSGVASSSAWSIPTHGR